MEKQKAARIFFAQKDGTADDSGCCRF